MVTTNLASLANEPKLFVTAGGGPSYAAFMRRSSLCLAGCLLLALYGCQTSTDTEPSIDNAVGVVAASISGAGDGELGEPSAVPDPGSLHTAELMVEGTDCASCSVPIRRHLKRLAGVTDIRQGESKQHVMLDFDPSQVSPEQIVQAVHEAGYEAEVLVYAKKS